jgi:hypothetical protein
MNLRLDSIVDVSVSVTPVAPASSTGCNVGLFIVSSVISASDRIKEVTNAAGVLTLGFANTSEEYKAAVLYFSQNPAPKRLILGLRDLTAETPETALAAYRAIHALTDEFYGVYHVGAADADNTALAAEIDGDEKKMLFFDTDNADALVESPTTPDVFKALKTATAKCAMGIYHSLANAGAALMGCMLGMETGETGSAFTATYKTLEGLTPMDITAAQLAILEAKNGNTYILRGQDYKVLEPGICSDGKYYDERMYLVMTEKVINQVVRDVKLHLRDGNSSVTIRLEPPELGSLRVEIATRGGAVTASIESPNAAVRNLLETNLQALKDSLSQAGIKVDSFLVSSGADFSQFAQRGNNPWQRSRNSHRGQGNPDEQIAAAAPVTASGTQSAASYSWLA